MTTVRLAQSDRRTEEGVCTKGHTGICKSPNIYACYGAGLFVTGEARVFAREEAYIST